MLSLFEQRYRNLMMVDDDDDGGGGDNDMIMIPIAITLVGIVIDVSADQAKAASPYDKGSVSIISVV